jgi:hypothetical protein
MQRRSRWGCKGRLKWRPKFLRHQVSWFRQTLNKQHMTTRIQNRAPGPQGVTTKMHNKRSRTRLEDTGARARTTTNPCFGRGHRQKQVHAPPPLPTRKALKRPRRNDDHAWSHTSQSKTCSARLVRNLILRALAQGSCKARTRLAQGPVESFRS